jgi:hypothetical protein
MRLFLDCEYNGFGGELLTLALVREDCRSLYLIAPMAEIEGAFDPWVLKNVIPIALKVPKHVKPIIETKADWPGYIADFLRDDPRPYIVTDWPDDIHYFCQSVITGPGLMASIKSLRFEMVRVDAYPTDLKGAIQHNAWHDANALRHLLMPV